MNTHNILCGYIFYFEYPLIIFYFLYLCFGRIFVIGFIFCASRADMAWMNSYPLACLYKLIFSWMSCVYCKKIMKIEMVLVVQPAQQILPGKSKTFVLIF